MVAWNEFRGSRTLSGPCAADFNITNLAQILARFLLSELLPSANLLLVV